MIILTNKYKPRISMRELQEYKPSELMRKHNLSEHGLQREVNKHCGDAKQLEQRAVYNDIYKRKE